MDQVNIIHFDLGSNMALAHNGCGDVVITDHFVATGPRSERAAQILRWLVKRKRDFKEAGIVFSVAHYERPFARGFDATRSGWGIAGLIEGVFGGDTVILDSTPQAIKSFAIGKPKREVKYEIVKGKKKRIKATSAERHAAAAAEKLLMIDAAQALGYMGNNEHEADAFLGLKYAEKHTAKGTDQCRAPLKASPTTRSSSPSAPSKRKERSLKPQPQRVSRKALSSAKSMRQKSAA
jgi:hypothetical protein